MVHQDNLVIYSNSLKVLKQQCTESGISEEDFRKLYFESLEEIETTSQQATRTQRRIMTRRKLVVLFILISVVIGYNLKYIYSNMQDYIYPGLRILRRLSIPFISLFPSLTDLYHETCLIQNPFFTVVDMDCWPCSTVINVREVYEPSPTNQEESAPFIYETQQEVITLEKLRKLYEKHKEIFDNDSHKVLINNKYNSDPTEMLNSLQNKEYKNYFLWKFNSMNAARILRQIIPRPKVVPRFGQSTERFIIIDTAQESIRIPDTECSFSFILMLQGSRTVDLRPAEECKHQCRTVKVDLKESYLLWYNWWYWKPVFQSSNGNETMIAHVGSYC